MTQEPNRDRAPLTLYDAGVLPSCGTAGRSRWVVRVVLWLAAAGLYGMVLAYDVVLMQWRYRLLPEGPRGLLREILSGFRDFGQKLPIIVILIVVLRMDRRRWTIVFSILIAQILGAMAYDTLKFAVARYRPQVATQNELGHLPAGIPDRDKPLRALSVMSVRQTWIGWSPPNRDDKTQSFPSGHSGSSFALAGVLSWFYPPLGALFWFLAAGCAMSRYLDAVHWLSDCMAGAAIGYAAAWLSLRPRFWAWPLWIGLNRRNQHANLRPSDDRSVQRSQK